MTVKIHDPPTAAELEQMHQVYMRGGMGRMEAPHVVYQEANCPYVGCRQQLQAIDFRLEDHGRAVHYHLVRAWWSDTGFVGRCPACGGWIHFAIRGKRAIDDAEAARLPQLPENWFDAATVL